MNAPAKISSFTGAAPSSTNSAALTAMKPTVNTFCRRRDVSDLVRKDTEVYAAPITDVIDAAQRMTPKKTPPAVPRAVSKAEAVGLSFARATPPAVTPRIARNSSARMTPVTRMPYTEALVMRPTLAGPVMPVSSMRCAPA